MLRIRELFRRFVSDEQGVALILVAIMLPVIIGFAVLAIDMARVNNLHNDLQKGADAFALAGAAELDGNPDAIDRANRAIDNLIANQTDFSTLNHYTLKSTDLTVTFLKSLPASDSISLDKNGVDGNGVNRHADPLTEAAKARFVEVTVNPTDFSTIFPASFIGGPDSFQVSTQAVAGFESGVCDYTPVFICNPYEDPSQTGGVTLQQAVASEQYRRRQILLRTGGNNSAYFPGNFGFLTPPTGHGAKALAEAIASSKPDACYSSNGVTTKTGQQVGPILGGLNIRFGIQEPGSNFNGPEYGPAANVRSGANPSNGAACPNGNKITYPSDPISAGLMGLPRDACFSSGSCSLMSGRMGGGNWDLTNYWAINHGGSVPTELWDGTAANEPTRYEVYRYELEHDLVADVSTGGESGAPKSGCGTPVTEVDRRLLYGAILNCKALDDAGYNLGGHDENLPVESFASFFLTEPIKPDSNTDIYVELVDVTGREGQGTLQKFQRDEAQLYR
jgi:Flp pilus assembly protein TadG